MTDLTAIDILIDPDEAALARARKVNARVLESMPEGWVLDDTHQPHITTLQRYVRTADLEHVYDAVQKTVADTDMASLDYQGVKITHADWGFPGYAPTVILVSVGPEVLTFQAKLVDAVAPFVEPAGTAAASSPIRVRRSARRSSTGSRPTCPTRSAKASTRPTSPSASPRSMI
jgi:hypothetical protein